MNQRPSSAPKLKAGPIVDLIREVRLCWRLLLDARVPLWVKGVPLLALLYVLFPFDLVPDLVVGLGQLDDLAVLVLGMELLVLLSPPHVVDELRREIQHGRTPPDGAGHAPGSGPTTVDASYRVVSPAVSPKAAPPAGQGKELPEGADRNPDKTRE